MYEQFYKYPAVIARNRQTPFARERERLLEYMAQRGYAKGTLMNFSSGLAATIDVLGARSIGGMTRKQIKCLAIRRFKSEAGGRDKKREVFITLATHWLRFIGKLGQDSEGLANAPLLERFVTWMRDEKGLSPSTIKNRRWHLAHFLRWYETRRRLISAVKLADIDGFLHWSAARGWGRRSIAIRASALRVFFAYAGTMGWCNAAIADAIEGPRLFAQETLPAGPTWEQVERLLANLDTDYPRDARDRAVILLLAVYGLRIGEVAVLSLEDIDWEHNKITFRRPKTGRTQDYPLVPIVGQAIIRYLREVRPRSVHREVFLTLKAPIAPMRHLEGRIRERIVATGIKLEHSGPHAFRHACATRLMAQGSSLKEIADHLGHESLQSTRTYSKVDLAGLREVATFDLGEVS